MKRSIIFTVLLCFPVLVFAQTYSISLGLFTGITSTYTFDKGITIDPRYQEKYSVKFAPIGINYGMDFDKVGFVLSPGLVNIGQDFYVVNTSGGQDGLRKIHQQYFNIPIAFKFHLINLSFFKVSAIGGAGISLFTKGSESVSHHVTKLKFAPEVYPILPPGYTILYDGVMTPKVDDYEMLNQHDFNKGQVFLLAGLHSNWDITDDWQMSFDFRVNYGLLEPRTSAYMNSLENYQELYALPGKRSDTFVQFSIGISRYVTLERKDNDRRKTIRNTTKKNTSKKYPWPAPRNRKPKQ